MIELLSDIHKAVIAERHRANIKHGEAFSGFHEAYAVIKEEYEEAEEEGYKFIDKLDELWNGIKRDVLFSTTDNRLDGMAELSEKAAAEWVQVAAMCEKARMR